MFCRNCGSQFNDGDMFCPNCGTRVAQAETPIAGFNNEVGAAFDNVREEAQEVYQEARATFTGVPLENPNVVGGAGYRVNNSQSSGAAAGSLVLGILSILCAFFGWIFPLIGWWMPLIGVILGIIGVVLGAKARKQAQTGLATGGFVCSIIGLVFCAVGMVCAIACASAVGGAGAGLMGFLDSI